jgi:hypothetical protein
VRAAAISLMILASTFFFMDTCFFITDKGSYLAIITGPTTRLHEGFFPRWTIVARRRFQFWHVVSRGRSTGRILIVVGATLIVSIVVTWAVGWTIKVSMTSMFTRQDWSRHNILGRDRRIIVFIPGVSMIIGMNNHMLRIGCRRVSTHGRVVLLISMPIVGCVMSLDFKRRFRLTITVRRLSLSVCSHRRVWVRSVTSIPSHLSQLLWYRFFKYLCNYTYFIDERR